MGCNIELVRESQVGIVSPIRAVPECGINENRLIIIEISCRAIHKLVSEYVDGELDPELRRRIESHLHVCRHCTAIVAGTANVIRLVIDGRVLELPRDFGEHLLERLRGTEPHLSD